MNLRCLAPLAGILALAACQTPADTSPASTAARPTASAVGPAASASTGDLPGRLPPDTVVATWKGGQITYGDLQKELGAHLIQQEVEYLTQRYSTESQGVDQLLVQKLVEAEAAKRGVETEALIKEEVESKVDAPTEAEIQQMYAAMQRQLRGAPLDQVHDQVAAQVTQRKQADQFSTWVDGLKKEAGATTSLPFPDMPRIAVDVDDDPSKGPADAKVTIVQFAEYQCPYCGKANTTVNELLKNYDGKIHVVFRDFPLSFHPRAIPAAVAANCAGAQGKYWDMHDLLMDHQRQLEDTDLEGYAKQVGVDMDQWKTCLSDPKIKQEISADMAAGSAVGVSGTPAFFINGIMLSGALPYDMFSQIIDKELAAG